MPARVTRRKDHSFPMRYQQPREKQTRWRYAVAKREEVRVIH
jgi:hypothetical protein